MTPKEFDNLQLTKDDFKITMDGVLIKYNSNIIKLILKRQEILNKLKKLTKNADSFNFTVKQKLGDHVYVRLDEIVSNIQKILESKK